MKDSIHSACHCRAGAVVNAGSRGRAKGCRGGVRTHGSEARYDCMITLKAKRSGAPIADAEFTVGADMPSMPGAHNVRPVPAEAHGMAGMYRARIKLDMTGEWALKLDFTKPSRDRLIRKLHFGGMEGQEAPKSGMPHGRKDKTMGHGVHKGKRN